MRQARYLSLLYLPLYLTSKLKNILEVATRREVTMVLSMKRFAAA